MNAPTKLAAFAVGVAAVFAGAAGIGAVAGPLDEGSTSTEQMAGHGAESGAEHNAPSHDAGSSGATELPGGLMVSQNGYTLDLTQSRLESSAQATLRFRVLGPDGKPVKSYEKAHGKDLHLIVVRRDMSGYQHVHPTLDADGEWSAEVDVSAAGDYRVYADFTPTGGDGVTLGADVTVAGSYEPKPLPEPALTTQVDGYTVSLDGTLVPGESSLLTLSVSKDGEPVTDLQPYLEAYGHLVALRDGDLAYLHVHPDGAPGDGSTKPGPQIRFYAEVPSAGSYRLFLDFKHGDRVRTAEFTANAGGSAYADDGERAAPEHAHSH